MRDGEAAPDRSHVSEVASSFDLRAATYDESELHRDLAAAVGRFAVLDDVETVLDVGTGTGLVLRALASSDHQLRLMGADVSPGMLAVARRAVPGAEFIEAPANHLPIPSASVDLISDIARPAGLELGRHASGIYGGHQLNLVELHEH